MNDRIKYLDVAKFIGIFCIYLGHFGDMAGNAYGFVFAFHVPLFFFLSGCAENFSKDIPVSKYIIKNIKNILIPCYIFALTALLMVTIDNNTHAEVMSRFMEILKGCIRNRYLASGLWFLTCLFIVKNAFYVIKKVFKFKWLILIMCVVLYCVAQLIMDPRPIINPHMLYNIDSACYYIIYYALGYYGFGMIQKLLDWKNPINKGICICIEIPIFIYAALLFFKKDLFTYININSMMQLVCPILKPMVLIVGILIIAKAIEDIELFGMLGKNTLYLCGSEYIIKLIFPLCLKIIGLNIFYPNPLAVYMYTFFLLVLSNKMLVPVEKTIFKKLHILD